MILLHIKSGIEHEVTPETWAKLQLKPFARDAYRVVSEPEPTKEVKNTVSRAKAKKDAEFEQDGFSNNDDAIPDGYVGQEQ